MLVSALSSLLQVHFKWGFFEGVLLGNTSSAFHAYWRLWSQLQNWIQLFTWNFQREKPAQSSVEWNWLIATLVHLKIDAITMYSHVVTITQYLGSGYCCFNTTKKENHCNSAVCCIRSHCTTEPNTLSWKDNAARGIWYFGGNGQTGLENNKNIFPSALRTLALL